MRKSIFFILFLFFLLPVFLPAKELTLENLYSEPTLIGIPPRSIRWSGDEKICAFLWNEEGNRESHLYSFSPGSVLKPEKIIAFEKEGISDFCWGRNNKEIFFIKGTSIFALDRETKETKEIFKNEKRKRSISLSPDLKYLAFLQEGNLWIYAFESASARQITDFDLNTEALMNGLWSPDSQKIAFECQNLRGARKVKIPYFEREEIVLRDFRRDFTGDPIHEKGVGIVEISTGNIQWINRTFDNLITLKWSPSGKMLLIEEGSDYAGKRNLFIAKFPGVEALSVYNEENLKNTFSWMWNSEWIDENQVALTSDRDGYTHLYSLDLRNKKLRQLTRGEWEVFSIYPAGKDIYFISNTNSPENRILFKVNLADGKIKRVGEKDGVYRPFISRSGQNISVLFSDDLTPFDLYSIQKEKLQRVTSSPRPEFYEYNWAKTEYRFIEGKDGAKIRVKMMFPPDFSQEKKYPAVIGSIYSNAVLNQWGGRDAHPTWGFDQYLVKNEKYILMNIDIRGSLGYGRKFREDMFKGYGVVDIEDIESSALYLKTLAYVDKDRIGIWGSSYGGLLTLMTLFKKPDLLACGIAGAPASNVFHAFPSQQEVLKALDKETFERSSAYYWSQGLKAPLQIIHGALDSTVLFIDSASLIQKMVEEGKDFEFVFLPKAFHAWDMGPSYQTIFAFKKMVDFFGRHLKK